MCRGTSISARTSLRSSSSESAPRARPAAIARQARTASWQVKALVEATPISGPARVGMMTWLSRAMDEDCTLTTDRMCWPLLLRIAQRGERVGGLARLRHEDRKIALAQRRFAIAEFGGDIDLDRNARVALEPVFGDEAGIIGGAAGRNRNALEFREIERQLARQHDALIRHVEIMRQRVRDDFRLLVDFLRHEMAVVALVDQERRAGGLDHLAIDGDALRVADLNAAALDHRPVAVFEIADRVGERRERDRIGAEIHLAGAMTDRERRAAARADHEIVFAGEDESERKRAAQARQRHLHGVDRRQALFHLRGDKMRDDFGVGLRAEFDAARFQLFAQFAEILDDAVMHDRELVGGMRMRVVFVRAAMRRPARVADAGHAGERFAVELDLRDFSACLRRGGARDGRSRRSRRPRNHSRDIQAASAHRPVGRRPPRVPESRQSRT